MPPANIFLRRFSPVFSACAVAAVLTGCASQAGSGPVAITKVNPVHAASGAAVTTDDAMVRFENRRIFLGAVESEEYRERYGNYISVFWRTSTKRPATVRLDYRQGSTGPRVHSKEIHVALPKSRNVTKFEIIGDEYHSLGKVTQWKASIIEEGQAVAEYRSFLWSD